MEVEEQNSKILESHNARTYTRLKIQQAVEGFSLIAISNYLIGLLKMTLEGLWLWARRCPPRSCSPCWREGSNRRRGTRCGENPPEHPAGCSCADRRPAYSCRQVFLAW
ncbi:DUF3422 family protein [Pseudomonas benzenivorans]|uniref:DUF3422 family protein n=1 Tax=Pseudomonas benzenivorans TaxID=556533 RepID=UPI00210455F9|nr:DUF3422 family protein [Pseudomonas benzenivorans]